IHPQKRGTPPPLLYPGKVTPQTFERLCAHLIRDYFQHPSYWRVARPPPFSSFDPSQVPLCFCRTEAHRPPPPPLRLPSPAARPRPRAAAPPGAHFEAVRWGPPILPAEKPPADPARLVRDLGFDSVTSYVWIHHVPLPRQVTDYDYVRDRYFEYWDEAAKTFGV